MAIQVFFKGCSMVYIALNNKTSIILWKEFSSNMATEVLKGTGEGGEKKCELNDRKLHPFNTA